MQFQTARQTSTRPSTTLPASSLLDRYQAVRAASTRRVLSALNQSGEDRF